MKGKKGTNLIRGKVQCRGSCSQAQYDYLFRRSQSRFHRLAFRIPVEDPRQLISHVGRRSLKIVVSRLPCCPISRPDSHKGKVGRIRAWLCGTFVDVCQRRLKSRAAVRPRCTALFTYPFTIVTCSALSEINMNLLCGTLRTCTRTASL